MREETEKKQTIAIYTLTSELHDEKAVGSVPCIRNKNESY